MELQPAHEQEPPPSVPKVGTTFEDEENYLGELVSIILSPGQAIGEILYQCL